MTENKMNEVAELLGVELEEEFRVKNFYCKFKISKEGLMYWSDALKQWDDSPWLQELLTGEVKIIKLPKPILNDTEKEYLSSTIKLFRDRKLYIYNIYKAEVLLGYESLVIEFLKFPTAESYKDKVVLPCFEIGTTYKGMKLGEKYTLEELGL